MVSDHPLFGSRIRYTETSYVVEPYVLTQWLPRFWISRCLLDEGRLAAADSLGLRVAGDVLHLVVMNGYADYWIDWSAGTPDVVPVYLLRCDRDEPPELAAAWPWAVEPAPLRAPPAVA